MTQEDRDILIRDLCMRVPYGVSVATTDNDGSLENVWDVISYNAFTDDVMLKHSSENATKLVDISEVRPYLRPLSSMTEEQMEELEELCDMYTPDDDYHPYAYKGIKVLYKHVLDDNYEFNFKTDAIIWLIANHFDVNGLIPKGLAKDATGLGIY